jgi:hypothetical protein
MTPLQNHRQQHPGGEATRSNNQHLVRAGSQPGFGFYANSEQLLAGALRIRLRTRFARVEGMQVPRLKQDGGTIVDTGPAEFRPVYQQTKYRVPPIAGAVEGSTYLRPPEPFLALPPFYQESRKTHGLLALAKVGFPYLLDHLSVVGMAVVWLSPFGFDISAVGLNLFGVAFVDKS